MDVSIASAFWELLAWLSPVTTATEKMKTTAISQGKEQTLSKDFLGVFQGALDSAVEGLVSRGSGLEIRVGSEGGEAGVRGAWALFLAGGLLGECPPSPTPSGLMFLPDVCIPARPPRRATPGQRAPTEPRKLTSTCWVFVPPLSGGPSWSVA